MSKFLRRRKRKKIGMEKEGKVQKKREGKGEEMKKMKLLKKKETTKAITQNHLRLLKITFMFELDEAKPPTVTVSPNE